MWTLAGKVTSHGHIEVSLNDHCKKIITKSCAVGYVMPHLMIAPPNDNFSSPSFGRKSRSNVDQDSTLAQNFAYHKQLPQCF